MKKVVDTFVPMGGRHCITNALKQMFYFYGLPLSEEMLFGVASGLSFLYLNQAASPMISGRTKIFEFEQKLANRLHIEIKCRQPKHYDGACMHTKSMLDQNEPVLIYADMPCLPYLNLEQSSHFGGHAVVIFGYDDENECYYVSDRDNHDYGIRTPAGTSSKDYHLVRYEDMKLARNSRHRPFPANNKYLEFDFSGFRPVTAAVIISAIKETCETMLDPPARLLGLNGIAKFAREIKTWNKFGSDKLRLAGITNYFQIHADGGTGGGIFRNMYGCFLLESDACLPGLGLAAVGRDYISLAGQWDNLASSMRSLGETGDTVLLDEMSKKITCLCEAERALLLELQRICKRASVDSL
ncbi:BtrH N-terminal domain-containing protein [Anaerolentibacter hominis]|uniref:BtrH N-terminal domain-containing protein n=1 Tax=Anaerolentibacter hominis TaxID=3079009 RepID=UPI0031B8879B